MLKTLFGNEVNLTYFLLAGPPSIAIKGVLGHVNPLFVNWL